jgi:hypothetical protein
MYPLNIICCERDALIAVGLSTIFDVMLLPILAISSEPVPVALSQRLDIS